VVRSTHTCIARRLRRDEYQAALNVAGIVDLIRHGDVVHADFSLRDIWQWYGDICFFAWIDLSHIMRYVCVSDAADLVERLLSALSTVPLLNGVITLHFGVNSTSTTTSSCCNADVNDGTLPCADTSK